MIESKRILSLENLQFLAKSPSLTTENALYITTRPTVITRREDENGVRELEDLKEGAFLIRSGCGALNEVNGFSMFMHGDAWGTVPNRDVTHYANPIYDRITADPEI